VRRRIEDRSGYTRDYFVRQADVKFASKLSSPPKEEPALQAWLKTMEREVEQLKRCATVNSLYAAPRLVIEGSALLLWDSEG
jgi:hypothetical protein